MDVKTIFQTIEDRGNPEYIENTGPFECLDKNAWLGKGYYFWDTFIENAHWWGGKNRSRDGYVICRATFDFNKENCYDLHGSPETQLEFQEILMFFTQKKLLKKDSKVVEIITFLKHKKIFNYPSIRVSSQKFNDKKFKIKFNERNPSRLELKPLIQICIYNLGKVNFNSYEIIFPDQYCSDYLV
jgi:hypothetical protein